MSAHKEIERSEAIRMLQRVLLLLAEKYYVTSNKMDNPPTVTVVLRHRSVSPEEVYTELAVLDIVKQLKCQELPMPKYGNSAVRVTVDPFRQHSETKNGQSRHVR